MKAYKINGKHAFLINNVGVCTRVPIPPMYLSNRHYKSGALVNTYHRPQEADGRILGIYDQ